MDEKKMSNMLVGQKMIEIAVNLDESLAEILRVEVKRLKRLAKNSNTLEELQKTNNLIRSIVIALTITDERIKTGIDLCMGSDENKHGAL